MATAPYGPHGAASGVDDVAEIVNYLRPPVVEVVASVRFAPLPHWLMMTLGEFWREQLQHDFPTVTEQPPYPAPAEDFDRPTPFSGIRVQVSQQAPPLPRIWWASTTGDELLQVQENWFACNWRRVAPDAQYGRWGSRRTSFRRRFDQLSAWIEARGSQLRIDQCEVTYINHILPSSGLWTSHAEAAAVFTTLNNAGLGEDVPGVEPEETRFQQRFLMKSADGLPLGRVHATMQPAFSVETDEPIFALELTARGKPVGETMGDALASLDDQRGAIVRCFAALTTKRAADTWGRQA